VLPSLLCSPQVLLSTAPDATGATHWGQQVFFLNPPVSVAPGDWISVDVDFQRKKENHRLMKVCLRVSLKLSLDV